MVDSQSYGHSSRSSKMDRHVFKHCSIRNHFDPFCEGQLHNIASKLTLRIQKERYTLMPHPNALSLVSLEGPDFFLSIYCKINLMKIQCIIQPHLCSGQQSGLSPGSPGFKSYHFPIHFSSFLLSLIHQSNKDVSHVLK